jgi:hypothetical protein
MCLNVIDVLKSMMVMKVIKNLGYVNAQYVMQLCVKVVFIRQIVNSIV